MFNYSTGNQAIITDITPIKQNERTPPSTDKSNEKKRKIIDMILDSDNNRVSVMPPREQRDPPISILKNRICPRNPSFPEKCLAGYENLKDDSRHENPRSLA